MLDLAATEMVLEAEVEAVLQSGDVPAFDLKVTPGNLDDRAVLARRGKNVIIRFRDISFGDNKRNPRAKCTVLTNSCRFIILLNANSLRTHRDLYAIAQGIICQVRGKIVGVNDAKSQTQIISPCRIESFTFSEYDDTKSCNKAEIVVYFEFSDSYENNDRKIIR